MKRCITCGGDGSCTCAIWGAPYRGCVGCDHCRAHHNKSDWNLGCKYCNRFGLHLVLPWCCGIESDDEYDMFCPDKKYDGVYHNCCQCFKYYHCMEICDNNEKHYCHSCAEDNFYDEMNAAYELDHNYDINKCAEYYLRKNVKYPCKSDRLNRKVKERQHFAVKWVSNAIVKVRQHFIYHENDPVIMIESKTSTIPALDNYINKRANRAAKRVKAPKEPRIRKGRGKNKQKTKGVQKEPRKIYVR